jgi:hypothetical protein
MRRREFITLIGAAAAWPLAGRAQQGDQMRRVRVLIGIAANDPDAQTRLAAFVQNLQQLGWTDGRNVRIDYRWGGGDADRVRKYAAALLALRPDLVFASGGAVEELLRATSAVPIVFAIVPDPVGSGFVDSLSRAALRNYRIPAFADTPRTEVVFADTHDKIGPFGAKSQGECAINAVAPAVANALANATGFRFAHLPFTPDRIFDKLGVAT